MTRPKGRQSAKAVEKDFPHFGDRLDTMYEFHDRHGIEAKRGHGWRDKKRAAINFADAVIAAAFANEFGPAELNRLIRRL
jgi:hypothetical protein